MAHTPSTVTAGVAATSWWEGRDAQSTAYWETNFPCRAACPVNTNAGGYVALIAQATGSSIQITWGQWALAALLPCVCMLLVMPLVLYLLYPPEIKETPGASELARTELAKLGPMRLPGGRFRLRATGRSTRSNELRCTREAVRNDRHTPPSSRAKSRGGASQARGAGRAADGR